MFNNRERNNYRGNNERLARNYRSPSPIGRNTFSRRPPVEEHRSRRDSTPDSDCLSNFYRDRFGSRSPDDYLNLRLSQFDHGVSAEHGTRLVYLNFEREQCAKTVRRKFSSRLRKQLGKHLALDPSGVLRDQEGKYIPDRYNRAAMAAADGGSVSPPPPRAGIMNRKRSPGGTANKIFGNDKFMMKKANFDNLNQDDTRATRTLFVGNLPGDVRETELRRVFEIYGKVEAIETKILGDSKAAFSFTVEEAIKARMSQHDRPVRPGSTKCQIGYGKSQRTARLYIGGLGSWATPDMIMNEFDRYGAIEQLEFVDIDSAEDACDRMKNFDLRGNGKGLITVDFAKDDKKGEKRKRGMSEDSDTKELGSPSMSPSEAGYISQVDELREKYPSTWKGILMLKKTEYPLRLHRVFGKEDLLQDLLRDDAGNSLKLNVSQRLPLDNTFFHKMMEYDKKDLALMIAPEGDHSNENLEKNAAGVITINGGVVYVLAYSEISLNILKFFAPRIAIVKPSSNHLLVALRKDNNNLPPRETPTTSSSPAKPGFLQNTSMSSLGGSQKMPSFLPPPPQLPPLPPKITLGGFQNNGKTTQFGDKKDGRRRNGERRSDDEEEDDKEDNLNGGSDDEQDIIQNFPKPPKLFDIVETEVVGKN